MQIDEHATRARAWRIALCCGARVAAWTDVYADSASEALERAEWRRVPERACPNGWTVTALEVYAPQWWVAEQEDIASWQADLLPRVRCDIRRALAGSGA